MLLRYVWREPMNKKAKSSGRRDEALEELLDAIGKGGLDPLETFGLEEGLRKIADDYLKQPGRLSKEQHQIMRRHVAETARRRERRKRFPDDDELVLAGWREADPHATEDQLLIMLDDGRPPNPAKVEADEARNITAYLKQADRKKRLRKYVIEPFFRLLEKHGIQSHPKKLPRTRMMRALFDWLKIEDELRPDDEAINAIVQDMRKRGQLKPLCSTPKAKPKR